MSNIFLNSIFLIIPILIIGFVLIFGKTNNNCVCRVCKSPIDTKVYDSTKKGNVLRHTYCKVCGKINYENI